MQAYASGLYLKKKMCEICWFCSYGSSIAFGEWWLLTRKSRETLQNVQMCPPKERETNCIISSVSVIYYYPTITVRMPGCMEIWKIAGMISASENYFQETIYLLWYEDIID